MHHMHLRNTRIARNESQTEFWGRFGVNQRTASRIECGQAIPPAVAILLRLYLDGVIGDADLERAQRRYRIALQNAPAQLLTECRA
ncbi:MAG: hypothetical protein RL651_1495 [Pseudomonadota bacterium]